MGFKLSRAPRAILLALAVLLVSGVLSVAGPLKVASADVGAPSWWNGKTCDTNNYPGSYALGASYNGVQACGPGTYNQGGTDTLVHFYSGAWGEYEWECVELVMRYMYLVYGIAPYGASGSTVVSNYSGNALTQVPNDGKNLPSPGDIISFAGVNANPNGHTAVITAVNVTNGSGTVTIMEQNATSDGWGKLTVSGNKITTTVLGGGVTGWLHNPNAGSGSTSSPTILQVKRTLAPDGTTHEVYAATNSTVTEAWWHNPGDPVTTDQVINISQNNIVGFDKVNQPDGVTQSLYTAVPDGVWETWWRPGDGPHSSKIVSGLNGVRQVIAANAYESGQYVHRLYLLAQDGPYEVWWKDGGDGVHWDRLNNITGGVAMTAGVGPDGAYEVFVATPTWVYQLWWFPGGTVSYRNVINITQGDIRSLSMGANLSDGTQLLYTGTSTTAWQSAWVGDNGSISTGTITVGQTNASEIEKDVYSGTHELYQTNGWRVQENWWNGSGSGSDTLVTISQNNITSFDKSDDGNYQQIYAASGNLVYETYWAAGVGPTSDVLFSVTS